MNPYQDVRKFHKATGLDVSDIPRMHPEDQLIELRMSLHKEEFKELYNGMCELQDLPDNDYDGRADALIQVADGICDLIYVLAGTAVSLGIPLEACWAEVQRSNMSKVPEDGIIRRREDGKILKPDTFSPADLHTVIFGQ